MRTHIFNGWTPHVEIRLPFALESSCTYCMYEVIFRGTKASNPGRLAGTSDPNDAHLRVPAAALTSVSEVPQLELQSSTYTTASTTTIP